VGCGQRYFDSGGFGGFGRGGGHYFDLPNEEKGASLNSDRDSRTDTVRKESCMAEKCSGVYVYNQTKETFLAFRVKVADSVLSRMVGLLGKRSLEPEGGVWIVPCNFIHTIGMLFTIDVVLLDKDFKVVGLHELVRPFSFTPPSFRAESVIELAPHTIFKSGTAVGDQFVIERYEASRHPSIESLLDGVPVGRGTDAHP
jgi:uncharacterized membrane protein (UPF0127 family)